jgi:hypothetical protein
MVHNIAQLCVCVPAWGQKLAHFDGRAKPIVLLLGLTNHAALGTNAFFLDMAILSPLSRTGSVGGRSSRSFPLADRRDFKALSL